MPKSEMKIETLLNKLFTNYKIAEGLITDLEQADNNTTKAKITLEISSTFQEIKRFENQLTQHRIECESRNEAISESNKKMVGEIVELVKELIPKLSSIEASVHAERSNLAPQIHQGIKAMQMVSAYGNNS